MRFVYKNCEKFPALAWFADIKNGNICVTCGNKVERNENFFVEGAWAGEYADGGFDTAEWFCGTGALIKKDRVIFASPTGMHAGLYMYKKDREVSISNSLPCLMAYIGLEFDPAYINYERDFNYNILQGYKHYNPKVHAKNSAGGGSGHYVKQCVKTDNGIRMIFFRNVAIREDGSVKIYVKPETKGFDSFEEYQARLKNAMKDMAENAKNKLRTQKYRVTSHISSGYDSACCAAIAKEMGATKVLTFEAKGKYAQDSGVGIAKQLGYEEVVERDPESYKKRTDYPETYDISGGSLGFGLSFYSFEQDIKDHLVLSGENGDFVWSKDRSFQNINDDIHIIWKNSEISLGEDHLHQEYIPVPMTNFGIRHWTDLYRISNSKEMEPWSVGGDYDRPIPRKILEEKGVTRDSFGVKKYGAGMLYSYDWKKRILSRLSPNSAKDFEIYIRTHRNRIPIKYVIRFIRANYRHYINTLFVKIGIAFRLKTDESKTEYRNSISNPFAARYLIPWAGNRVIQEYKEAMEQK